jgi:glycosyltransferase involved in cell wall biosynthesis
MKKKNKHIAILLDELAPGSAPKISGLMYRYLKRAGYEVTLLIINNNNSYKKNKEIYDQFLKGIKIIYLMDHVPEILKKINFKFPFMSFFSFHHIIVHFYAYRALVENKKKIDLVISHCQYTSLASLNFLKKLNIKFLLLIWDPSTFIAKKIYRKKFPLIYPFIYLGAKILDKIALSRCESLITSSKFHHKKYKQLTNKKLEILHLGCFPTKKLKKDYSKGKIILSFDRWDIGNDPSQLLDILNGLSEKRAKLYIGGYWYDDRVKKNFFNKIDKLSLKKRVVFLGPLNETQIKYYSKISSINIHHIHDAFATTILEGSGYGCPGIVPYGCGVDEFFKDKESILLVKDTRTITFVKKLDEFFSNKKLRDKITKNSWKEAKNKSWEINYGKVLPNICNKYIT